MSQKKRTPKRRLVYREHDQQKIHAEIRAAVPEGGLFWDYLSSIVQDRVHGPNEFERGVAEGMRELADQILSIAMSKPEPKVENEQED